MGDAIFTFMHASLPRAPHMCDRYTVVKKARLARVAPAQERSDGASCASTTPDLSAKSP
jgi:hypothetical protein